MSLDDEVLFWERVVPFADAPVTSVADFVVVNRLDTPLLGAVLESRKPPALCLAYPGSAETKIPDGDVAVVTLVERNLRAFLQHSRKMEDEYKVRAVRAVWSNILTLIQ
jgi:hypothetical protein